MTHARTLVTAFLLFFSAALDAQAVAPRIEHIGINVADAQAVVAWYAAHLGFSVLRKGPAPQYSTVITDSSHATMALEIYQNAEHPLLSPDTMHPMALHLALAVDSLEEVTERLLKAGARVAEAQKQTASGDRVITLRDPWGFSLQLVRRVHPMLHNRGLSLEHVAFNVEDARAKAAWLSDNLGCVTVREGKPPAYSMFIADSSRHMMIELYQDARYPRLDFNDLDYMATHFAFAVPDVAQTKARLLKAGAHVAEEMKQLPNGDTVLMLRDPWGQPLQIVHRVTPIFP
ncbi:MAG: VOC family protein [Acidobacteriota bacterium]